MNATVEQVGALDSVTEMLVAVERTLNSVLAARDGLFALGARIAVDTARGSAGDDGDDADMTTRAVAAELGAALRMNDRTVQRRMADADLVVTLFPRIWRAQGAGMLSAAHARVIIDAALHLGDSADRDAYAREMIGIARTESPNRVARAARRAAEHYQPRTIDERHRSARKTRALWVRDRADGMSELSLLGPSALVHGAFDRITAMAKSVHENGQRLDAGSSSRCDGDSSPRGGASDVEVSARADSGASFRRDTDAAATTTSRAPSRTLAQTRCDVTLDLLLTGAPFGHDSPDLLLGSIVASVSVTVPALTLIGASTTPAELDGRCPIDADTARRFAGAAAGWDRVLTHPVTGLVLAVDRYRPTSEMRRHLRARDQRCRFPTCGQQPRDCDVDHGHDHALGGATEVDNLATLCRRHHSLKHHTPWHVEHLGGGLLVWTSPGGRTYVDSPPTPVTASVPDETPSPSERQTHFPTGTRFPTDRRAL